MSVPNAVKMQQGHLEEFEVNVGVHQVSVLTPLVFVIVLEALTCDMRKSIP